MATEKRSVIQNGVVQSVWAEVDLVADFVVPCSYCGVPCTGTFRAWYLDGDRWVTFETDRGSLSELLEPLVKLAIEKDEYDSLPSFVRAWNECSGWATLVWHKAPW